MRAPTLDALADALGLGPEDLLAVHDLSRDLRALERHFGRLTWRGLGVRTGLGGLDLDDDTFVPPRLRPVGEPHGPRDRADRYPADTDSSSLDQALASRRVLLIGDPGSGKTTVLQFVAAAVARAGQLGEGRWGATLPFFVRGVDLVEALEHGAGPIEALLVSLRAVVDVDRLYPIVGERLAHGEALILLDGFDEIPFGERQRALDWLQEIAGTYPRCRLILSSRPHGLSGTSRVGLDFQRFEVCPWTPEQVAHFVRVWNSAHHAHSPARDCASCASRSLALIEAIRSSRQLEEIAANPLMLTILAGLHQAQVDLPRRRALLYARVADALLETWNRAKHEGGVGQLGESTLEARECGWLLGHLALVMHEADRVQVPRWWLTDEVRGFLANQLGLDHAASRAEADRVLRYLVEQSGLIVERDRDRFAFSHLTLQEYFASRGLQDAEGAGQGAALVRLRPHLFRERWVEVVRLLSAQLPPARVAGLVRPLLNDSDRAGRFLLRGPLIALGCLADGAVVAESALLDHLFVSLVEAGRRPWIELAEEVLSALRELDGTRYQRRAREAHERVLAAVGEVHGERVASWLRYQAESHDLGPLFAQLDAHDIEANLGLEIAVSFGGMSHHEVASCRELFDDDPDRWVQWVRERLRDEATEAATRGRLVELLTRVFLDERLSPPSGLLLEVLDRDPDAGVRARAAHELVLCDAQPQLRGRLEELAADEGESAQIRAACVTTLEGWVDEGTAEDSARTCRLLLRLLESSAATVREEATLRLGRWVAESEVRAALLGRIAATDEEVEVRASAVSGVAEALSQRVVAEAVRACLRDQPPGAKTARVAAVVLGGALGEGRIDWDGELVAQVEEVLLVQDQTRACQHTREVLMGLVEARESVGGRRLEQLLGDALDPVTDRIDLAFVYGSVASQRETLESDVDLMIVGDVSLRRLSELLTQPERALARRINPTVYSVDSFRSRVDQGNPFLIDVLRKPKIFLKGGDRELGTMARERLAP